MDKETKWIKVDDSYKPEVQRTENTKEKEPQKIQDGNQQEKKSDG